jgi:hypothetical protein
MLSSSLGSLQHEKKKKQLYSKAGQASPLNVARWPNFWPNNSKAVPKKCPLLKKNEGP